LRDVHRIVAIRKDIPAVKVVAVIIVGPADKAGSTLGYTKLTIDDAVAEASI
jgi:hypothetical protein